MPNCCHSSILIKKKGKRRKERVKETQPHRLEVAGGGCWEVGAERTGLVRCWGGEPRTRPLLLLHPEPGCPQKGP